MRIDTGDRKALFGFALLGALKALALVAIAEGIARGIAGFAAGDGSWADGTTPLLAGAALRGLITWITHVAGARAAIGVKQALRQRLTARALRGGTDGGTVVTATLGLDELDSWYRTVLPAIAATATIPLLVGARILAADWLSAVIIVITVPLVPVFMALVGLHAKDSADTATATLARLANHAAELARGLPVLVGLGRVEEQSNALGRISDEQRVATVRTLRSAFLSSLVLELIATISVAVVAVFVGLRLLSGDLTLEVGLLALVLAPECFAPFRELGTAFHASQSGLAAKRRVTELLDAPERRDVRAAKGELVVTGLHVPHAGISSLTFWLPRGTTTAITGASGAGKSTLLGVLAGTVTPESGIITGIDPARVAYAPQHPRTVADTVLGELKLYGAAGANGMLDRFGLTGSADPSTLSPGELRRLAVARALLRVEEGATLLLLDEPTAHLDAASALVVEQAIAELHGTLTIVIASHDAAVVELADLRVALGVTRFRADPLGERVTVATDTTAPRVRDDARVGGWRELMAFLRPTLWRTLAGAVLGAAAALSGLALLGTSGWLIVEASSVDAIMYLLVAIVGVRFFGLGRAALRYAERLLTHDAALGSIAALRRRLWANLAARGLSSRALASGDAALDHLVVTPERILQLVPRIIPPIATAVLASTGVIVTTALLAPAALGAVVLEVAVGLVLAPAVALLADRAATRGALLERARVIRGVARVAHAAEDLAANGVAALALTGIRSADADASAASRRAASATGLGAGVVVIASGTAAALAIGLGAPTAGLLAVVVLLALGLVDPLLGAVEAVQLIPALRAQLGSLAELTSAPTSRAELSPGEPEVVLDQVAVAWPGADPVFRGANAHVGRGEWLIVEGPSGSGKSTLVAALLGYLPAAAGRITVRGDGIAWAPQEAHIFDSTVRGNLLLAGSAPDAVLRSVLDTVGLSVDLDTRVGSEGSHLSGGERQRLAVARALLTKAEIVLLDEPTAHLDALAAENLMIDLRIALADRAVVLVTHHADEVLPEDSRLALGAPQEDAVLQLA